MPAICPCASASALRKRLGPQMVIYGARFYVLSCIAMKHVHHVAPKYTKGELYTVLSLVPTLLVFILVFLVFYYVLWTDACSCAMVYG